MNNVCFQLKSMAIEFVNQLQSELLNDELANQVGSTLYLVMLLKQQRLSFCLFICILWHWHDSLLITVCQTKVHPVAAIQVQKSVLS